MTLQEIGQAWKDIRDVWCIFGNDVCEARVTRCDVSVGCGGEWYCDRLDVSIGPREVQTFPSDIFLTRKEADTELLKRKERPALRSIVTASIRVCEALAIMDFYTDEDSRAVTNILREADGRLNKMINKWNGTMIT